MDSGCTVVPFRGGLENRTAGGGHGHPLCMEREVAQGESIYDSLAEENGWTCGHALGRRSVGGLGRRSSGGVLWVTHGSGQKVRRDL